MNFQNKLKNNHFKTKKKIVTHFQKPLSHSHPCNLTRSKVEESHFTGVNFSFSVTTD